MNRKFKKLLRNPKLFVKDMVVKHGRKMGVLPPDPETLGYYQYTVVSAVYNVGRYLDDFFNSLVKQKLDFKRHIHLIMVDDGSTDNSAEIIKGWQKKYPDNITYIWKENGGQASARNLGLELVKTEWVTFIDPDDFLEKSYFYNIDREIYNNKDNCLELVCTNLIFFFEEKNEISDTHPLRYRFDNPGPFSASDLKNNIQLSASTAIFKTGIIASNNIRFNCDIKPSFEDAHFVNIYLCYIFKKNVTFLKKAKYIYRKRSDGSSTLDKSWKNPSLFDEVLQIGCIGVLEQFKKNHNYVPVYIQRTILYHLIWYIKKIIRDENSLNHLSTTQKDNFISKTKKIFSYIDAKTILSFNLAGTWFLHKVGMLYQFKGISPDFNIAYISAYDAKKNQILIKYFSSSDELEEIKIDEKRIIPDFRKKIQHKLNGEKFIDENLLWIPIPESGLLSFSHEKKPCKITLGSKQHPARIAIESIKNYFSELMPFKDVKNEFSNSWLFIDRDAQADDNAEHLYRYIKNNHPDQKIYFSLSRESHDWERLISDGFNLIEFGSDQHAAALQGCEKLISSNIDKYISNFLGPRMMLGRHTVFLQHGVIMHDHSSWLNTKEQIDCFITTTPSEYNSIISDDSLYKFTKKEVVLTGLPRHDSLLANRNRTDKIIVIMPTWRNSIVGKAKNLSFQREFNHDFVQTDFFKHWNSLIQNNELKQLCSNFNFRIFFFPHVNLQPYIPEFNIPDHIEVITHENGSIQNIFQSTSIMITDYSSVAFEMAIQDKPVIYYQFDSSEIASGSHTFKPGYFNYKKDGFGPVVIDERALLNELEHILRNDGRPSPAILERIKKTFPFRDGNNCERAYQAIIALDSARDPNFIDAKIIQQYAKQARKNHDWPFAERLWTRLIECSNKPNNTLNLVYLSEALRCQGKLQKAENILGEVHTCEVDNFAIMEKARIAMACHNWNCAIDLWHYASPLHTIDRLHYLQCLAELQLIEPYEIEIKNEWALDLPGHHKALVGAWLAIAKQEWQSPIDLMEPALGAFSEEELYLFKPELLLACCLRKQGLLDQAHKQLAAYEKHTTNDPLCREQIALLAQTRGQWDKVVDQLQKAYAQLADMPQPLAPIYAQSLRQLGKEKEAEQAVVQWLKQWPDNLALRQHAAELMLKNQRWEEAMLLLPTLFTSSQDALRQALLPMISTLRANGKLTQAESLFAQCFGETGDGVQIWSDAIWHERANLHMARQQWQQVLCCLDCMEEQTPFDFLMHIQSLAELGYVAELEALLHTPVALEQEASLRQLALAWHCVALQDWPRAASLLLAEISSWSTEDLRALQPQLLLARCLREQGLLDAAHAQLAAFERHSANHPQCRVQIALLASVRGQWDKVLAQISRAYPTFADQPEPLLAIYIQALRMLNKIAEAELALQALLPSHPNNQELQIEAARLATDCGFWSQAIIRWSHLLSITAEAPFKLAEAYRMTGQLEQAFLTLSSPSCRIPANVEEWKLKAEIAQLTNQWDQAAECWVALIQYYPDQANQENWERLNSVQVIKALKDNNMPLMT
ncbi:beta-1,3-glucosyltransferase [Chromobacterium sinusclupearum]|uniref:Beta-1,3-glucosyltransferase n=1 Tax=Chromobacterium sinusclupearum TaxID=2077146 RepID=A0A2K4MKM7_9NEIS|nr:CDP-glycerol glycerophosphotransferase family protein [Chromobacterium sinusclupearum]POA97616.1 beta-1,3-glucosyltransferase [Chromobacterium sinusclupearum]